MILMIEKGISGRICQAAQTYAKANNKYMKNCDKNIESSYIEYLDANNLHGWAMSEKLTVKGFNWVKQKKNYQNFSSQNMMKKVIKYIFLK